MMRRKPIYYLPGRDEPLLSGPGKVLREARFEVRGRTLPGDLTGLGIDEQVELIRSDLFSGHWRPDAAAVGRSFGAYLLLHALAGMSAFPGSVLLFSPVIGAATVSRDGGFYGAIPPRAGELEQLAMAQGFPPPASLEIYLGDGDLHCSVDAAREFAFLVGGRLSVIPRADHELPSATVRAALRRALPLSPK